MDIAAMSITLSSSKVLNAVGTSVLKKVMDQQEIMSKELMNMIPSDPYSGLGQNIDIKA